MSIRTGGNRWAPTAVIVVAAALFVVVAGLALLWFAGHGGTSTNSEALKNQADQGVGDLPQYILAADEPVAMAYRFALDRPDVMIWMPCYCGCGGHSGHKNARDCFVNPESSSGNIKFDEHGSQCDVCVNIALLAREMTIAGSSLSETRAAVDAEFSDVGPGTDTPLPPE